MNNKRQKQRLIALGVSTIVCVCTLILGMHYIEQSPKRNDHAASPQQLSKNEKILVAEPEINHDTILKEQESVILALKEQTTSLEEQVATLIKEHSVVAERAEQLEETLHSYSEPAIMEKMFSLEKSLSHKESLMEEMRLAQDALYKEIDSIRNQNLFLRETCEELQKTSANKDLSSQQRVNSLLQQVAKLEKSLILKEKELKTAEMQSAEKEELLEQIATEKSNIITTMQNESKEHKAQLEEMAEERERLAVLQEEKEKFLWTINDYKNKLHAETQQRQKVQLSLNDAINTIDSLHETTGQLSQKVESFKQQNKELEHSLESVEKAHATVVAESSVLREGLKEKRDKHDSLLQQYTQTVKEKDGLMEALNADNDTLQRTIQQNKNAYDELQQLYTDTLAANTALSDDIDGMKSTRDILQQRYLSLEKSYDAVLTTSGHHNTVRRKLEEERRQHQITRKKLHEFSDNNTSLQEQLSQSHDHYSDLSEEHHYLADKCYEIEGRLMNEEEKTKRMQRIVKEKTAHEELLSGTIANLEKVNTNLANQNNALNKKLEYLEKTISSIQNRKQVQSVSRSHSPDIAYQRKGSHKHINITRVHLVGKNETLEEISSMYYGAPARWRDIMHANKELISDKDNIKAGTPLVIP